MTDSSDLPASWSSDERGAAKGSRRWILFVVLALVVLGVGATLLFRFLRDDADRAWPASLSGRPSGLGQVNEKAPTVKVTAAPGVYVWNDFDGWHVWVVQGEGLGAVTGSITSDKSFQRGELAVPGSGRVTRDGKEVAFTLSADAPLSGVDFEPGFYAKHLTVALESPDGTVATKLVTLGPKTAATGVPVKIDKLRTADAKTS